MNEQITVIARFKTKPETAAEFEQIFAELVGFTRHETGCLNYDLHRDLEDPTLFFMHETWANADALDEHFDKPYIDRAFAASPRLLAEPAEIRRLEMISPKA